MTYILRPYQKEAVDAAVRYLRRESNYNAIEVHITPEDFLASLPSADDAENLVIQGLNTLGGFMGAIPDTIIAKMKVGNGK